MTPPSAPVFYIFYPSYLSVTQSYRREQHRRLYRKHAASDPTLVFHGAGQHQTGPWSASGSEVPRQGRTGGRVCRSRLSAPIARPMCHPGRTLRDPDRSLRRMAETGMTKTKPVSCACHAVCRRHRSSIPVSARGEEHKETESPSLWEGGY